MPESKKIFSDNEYNVMSEIGENENISQRELSRKLGVSVSTVNLLINKMTKEGMIKMTQVSQKQVFYMLTPVGMMEKARKTVSYLKAHYRAIYETNEKIKSVLEELNQKHDGIFVLKCGDEMDEIIGIAVEEFQARHSVSNIRIIDNREISDIRSFKSPVLLHMTSDEDVLETYGDVEDLVFVGLGERI